MINKKKSLFEIADSQQGFFTARQAINCRISSKNHSYFVKTGKWIKEGRGIYRLSDYPITERPDLMKWFLWSRDINDHPQGVFSHATALILYDLSDYMTDKIHMTVPKNFRRFNKIPKILKIYKIDLPKEDIKFHLGIKVTTPIRTIIDIIEEGTISNDFINQAIEQAVSRGLIISKIKILEHSYLKNNRKLKIKIENYL
jgi:predicted transcriptional regulator of viral defense system